MVRMSSLDIPGFGEPVMPPVPGPSEPLKLLIKRRKITPLHPIEQPEEGGKMKRKDKKKKKEQAPKKPHPPGKSFHFYQL